MRQGFQLWGRKAVERGPDPLKEGQTPGKGANPPLSSRAGGIADRGGECQPKIWSGIYGKRRHDMGAVADTDR
jgi:hypothetical protein